MYQDIEAGKREGKGHIWDALEALFGIPQRQLRNDDTQPDYSNSISVGIGEAKELESAMKSFGLDVDAIIDIAQDGRLDEPARRETAERLAKVLVAVLSGKSAA
jgi:hypothetical protein